MSDRTTYYHPWGLRDPKRVLVEVLGEVTHQHIRVRLLEDGTMPTQGPGLPFKKGTVVRALACDVVPPPETLEEAHEGIRRLYQHALKRGYRDGVRETRERYSMLAWRARLGGLRVAARIARELGAPEVAAAIRERLPKEGRADG